MLKSSSKSWRIWLGSPFRVNVCAIAFKWEHKEKHLLLVRSPTHASFQRASIIMPKLITLYQTQKRISATGCHNCKSNNNTRHSGPLQPRTPAAKKEKKGEPSALVRKSTGLYSREQRERESGRGVIKIQEEAKIDRRITRRVPGRFSPF